MLQIHLHDDRGILGDREIVIDRFPAVVGRHSACDLRLNSAFVSRRHCLFFLEGERAWVQDLESLNGTYVNGMRLGRPQVLRDGDRVSLGPVPFQVSVAVTTGPGRSRPRPEKRPLGRNSGRASAEQAPC